MTIREHTLVFADDGSTGADVAWLWVQSHRWPQWRIEVVTATKPGATPVPAAESALHAWTPANPRVAFSQTEARVSHLAAVGDPRVVLAESNAQLLVIGSRGKGLLKALHLGSTAEWLMECPPAPLIIARHGHPTRTVLVCADGSPDADAAINSLAGMPWLDECTVHVLTIADGGLDPDAVNQAAVEVLAPRAGEVRQLVRRPNDLDVFFHVRELIFEAIADVGADLVVHGSRGISPLAGLRVGSIAASLARHAPCSVLLTHAEPSECG